jgi:hypothetical protein
MWRSQGISCVGNRQNEYVCLGIYKGNGSRCCTLKLFTFLPRFTGILLLVFLGAIQCSPGILLVYFPIPSCT